MIEEYFHLDRQPFKISTDPRFYFDSERHRKALSYLQYGLQQAEGFVVVTGDAGVGKTTLVEQFILETAQTDILTGTITAGHVEPGEIIDYVLFAFRLETKEHSYPVKHNVLEEFLKEQHQAGRHVLLIVDEAQNLIPETLEELRALSGITMDGSPLLQIFLLGQSAFKSMLAREAMEQFRQRVIAACHLPALDKDETAAYIDYRLAVAGWEDEQSLFTDRAHAAVFHYTAGVPRIINKLCARLLLQVALDERDCVNVDIVTRVIEDLEEEALGFSEREADKGQGGAVSPAPVLRETPDISGNEVLQKKTAHKDNIVPLASVERIEEPLVEEQEHVVVCEERAAVNGGAPVFTNVADTKTGAQKGGDGKSLSAPMLPRTMTTTRTRPLSAGLSSILDRLRPGKRADEGGNAPEVAKRPAPESDQADDDLLIPSLADIPDETPDQPEEASLEEVADEIAAHQTDMEELEAAPLFLDETDTDDDTSAEDSEEDQEEELPVITEIEEGTTPALVGLKTDLAGFITELREGLMTVENNMSVVQDRAIEVETGRTERNEMISRRLSEIDTLLKEMRGGR